MDHLLSKEKELAYDVGFLFSFESLALSGSLKTE